MISTAIVRGLLAGLLAGLVAGLFALAFAEPSIDGAIALEEAAAAEAPEPDAHHAGGAEDPGISRTTQKVGLVVGTSLYGIGVGALFGVAMAWSRGRLRGDVWTRALKLGGTAAGVLVVLPAIAYAPNPPAVGDPGTIGSRTTLYVVTCVIGLTLAIGPRRGTPAGRCGMVAAGGADDRRGRHAHRRGSRAAGAAGRRGCRRVSRRPVVAVPPRVAGDPADPVARHRGGVRAAVGPP